MSRTVTEVRDPGAVPLYRHPGWAERFPWLVQGTTGAGEGEPFDLGAFGQSPVRETIERWAALRDHTRIPTAIHSRQVHGVGVGVWQTELPPGLFLTEGLDAHVASRAGLLLAVSVADCVPIFLACERTRNIGAVHAGWRGVAGGALEAAVAGLRSLGSDPADLWLHCGPSICGKCYEVGPEVHEAVHPDRHAPSAPTPIDLRAALLERASALGLRAERLSVSAHCTRCGPGSFFSHRGGNPQRQMGVIGRLG